MPIRPIDHGIFAGVGGIVGAAYFAGGDAYAYTDIVNKFSFVDDSRTTLGTGLSSARWGTTGLADSGVSAYFAGGYS